MWRVNWRADHALQTVIATENNFKGKPVKVYVCAIRWTGAYVKSEISSSKRRGVYEFNKPGAKIWAYIVLCDSKLKDVREGHIRLTCEEEPGGIEACFVEISREHLEKIAPLPYGEQCLPSPP